MDTKLLILKDFIRTGTISEADAAMIREAADAIRSGGLAAFPTETVYGLGGNALLADSSRLIYAAKGRPSDNPLIVHIADISMLDDLAAAVPETAKRLSGCFWPGPLTMIFRKKPVVPDETTGGLGTCAVRFPSHPVALRLIKESRVPVAAPSANRSGRPSTTRASHCMEDLDGRVDIILDGGCCNIGLESTIIDVTAEKPVLLRPGAVTMEMIRSCLGFEIDRDQALDGPLAEGVRPKAPGMKYRHYAPRAPLMIVCAKSPENVCRIPAAIMELLSQNAGKYSHISLLCSFECHAALKALGFETRCTEKGGAGARTDVRLTGSRSAYGAIAHDIFEELREYDSEDTDLIIAEGYSETGIGLALMNRLKKAAAWQIVYV